MRIIHRQSPAQPGQIIVIREKRRGCGCGLLLLLAVAVGALTVHRWYRGEAARIEARAKFDRTQRAAPTSPPAPQTQAPHADGEGDAWTVQLHRDKISDAETIICHIAGLHIEDGIIDYTPRLVVRIPRGAPLSAAVCYLLIEPEAIARGGTMADVRVDRQPAETMELTPGANRSAVFLPDGFAPRLDGAQTLVVRLTTSLGNTRTLCFTLGGVSLADVASRAE